MESCCKCGARTIKTGSVKGRPKRKCEACGFQSVGEDKRGKPEEMRHFGVMSHSNDLSLNAAGKLLGVKERGGEPEPGCAVIVTGCDGAFSSKKT